VRCKAKEEADSGTIGDDNAGREQNEFARSAEAKAVVEAHGAEHDDNAADCD
jgi:hypothetical protein